MQVAGKGSFGNREAEGCRVCRRVGSREQDLGFSEFYVRLWHAGCSIVVLVVVVVMLAIWVVVAIVVQKGH